MIKKALLIIFVSFLFQIVDAQGLFPSKVREVFYYEVGDSFEYSFSYSASYQPAPRGEVLLVITGITNKGDSLFYAVKRDTLSFHPVPSGLMYPISFLKMPEEIPTSVYNLDSNAFQFIHSFNRVPYCKQTITTCYDSVDLFDNHKSHNMYGWYGLGQHIDSYVDSIGLISRLDFMEGDNYWMSEKLKYYHKANGQIWGTPISISGIVDLSDNLNIQVYPNPTKDNCILNWKNFSDTDKSYVSLYDIFGKFMRNIPITSQQTTIAKQDLANGLYFWQITKNNRIVQKGKLVFE